MRLSRWCTRPEMGATGSYRQGQRGKVRGFNDRAQDTGADQGRGGRFDRATFESFTNADIERMIDEDPDLAPCTETLPPYLQARNVRTKLGLTPAQFAEKLGLPVAA